MKQDATLNDWFNLAEPGEGGPGPFDTLTQPKGPEAGPEITPKLAGYDIVEELGRGGMGVVYKARQTQLNRLVAIKVLHLGGPGSAAEQARFRTEAQAVAQLQHRHIVQIFEVGTQDGLAYLVLEYVAGGTLAQHIAGKPQPAADAARLVRFLAEAMAFAHDRNILHRDLKPANILLERGVNDAAPAARSSGLSTQVSSASGTKAAAVPASIYPKIADFGLAKHLTDDASHTKTGDIVGTPSYMSPEQAAGKTRQLTASVDIYALGAILYELLTGRPPFQGLTPMDTLLQVMSAEPVAPRSLIPSVPRDLETICLKCLQKEPEKRYASARLLAEDLERFLAGQPISARPVSGVERLVRWCKRNPQLAGLTAASALLALAAVGAGFLLMGEYHRAEQASLRRALSEEQAQLQAEQAAKAATLEMRQWLAQAETSKQWAHWAKALQAAKEARQQLQKLPNAARAMEELDVLLPRLINNEANAAEREKDERMVATLDQIALGRSDHGRQREKESRTNQKYAAAFRGYGIDVEKLNQAEAAARLKSSKITGRLIEALDDWALIRYEEADAPASRWMPLTHLANAVDTVPFRQQLRAAMDHRDTQEYLRLSRQEGVEHLGDRALFLLARLLWLHRQNDEAIRFVERAIVRDPNEVHYYFLISRALREQNPVPWERLLRYQSATLALRDQAFVHRSLGATLEQLGEPEQALEHRLRAQVHNQDPLNVLLELANAYRLRRQYAEAEAVYRQLLAEEPDHRRATTRLAEMLLKQGKFAEAAAQAQRGLAFPEQKATCEKLLRQANSCIGFQDEPEERWAGPADASASELRDRAQFQLWQRKAEASFRIWQLLRARHPEAWQQLSPSDRLDALDAAALVAGGAVQSELRQAACQFTLETMTQRLGELRVGLDEPVKYEASREELVAWCCNVALRVFQVPSEVLPHSSEEAKAWRALWDEVRGLLRSR